MNVFNILYYFAQLIRMMLPNMALGYSIFICTKNERHYIHVAPTHISQKNEMYWGGGADSSKKNLDKQIKKKKKSKSEEWKILASSNTLQSEEWNWNRFNYKALSHLDHWLWASLPVQQEIYTWRSLGIWDYGGVQRERSPLEIHPETEQTLLDCFLLYPRSPDIRQGSRPNLQRFNSCNTKECNKVLGNINTVLFFFFSLKKVIHC